jgi:hypothetical protein
MNTQANSTVADPARQLLRHTLATLSYRGGKTLRGAPGSFAQFSNSQSTRTPAQILAHLGDLLDWGLSMANGERKWHSSEPLPWDQEVARFFAALHTFDAYLASDQPLKASTEKLFQGPVADSFTHVGQLAILRRMAGAPIKAENYFRAEIVAGRVGAEQAAPAMEFD